MGTAGAAGAGVDFLMADVFAVGATEPMPATTTSSTTNSDFDLTAKAGTGDAQGSVIDLWSAQTASDALFLEPGTHSWTAPEGVTSICILCIGGGAGGHKGASPSGGGGAGGLGYKNSYSVTPGNTYEVYVGYGGYAKVEYSGSGAGGNGETSHFKDGSTFVCRGYGGTAGGAGGSYQGDGGGSGGSGGTGYSDGGGGAGGYSGNGGNGSGGSGGNGSGGGGGGGSGNNGGTGGWGGMGGSVGFFGEGTSGTGGTTSSAYGVGGSGGSGGHPTDTAQNGGFANHGIFYRGAGGQGGSNARSAARGGHGVVRITWRSGCSFPSTNTEPEWSDSLGHPMQFNVRKLSAAGTDTTSFPHMMIHNRNVKSVFKYMYASTTTQTNNPFSGSDLPNRQGYFRSMDTPTTTGPISGTTTSSSYYSTYQFAPTAKFYSNVEYTGNGATQTISHSLEEVPAFMLTTTTNVNQTPFWYHKDLGNNYAPAWNAQSTKNSSTQNYWNNTTPTDTNFYVGGSNSTNSSEYLAHLFAEVPGLVKIDTWTGNGSSTQDIDCGFTGSLQFIMWCAVTDDDSQNNKWWMCTDKTKLSGSDFVDSMWLGSSQNGSTLRNTNLITRISGGFRVANNTSYTNYSGTKYIYVAIGTDS